MTGFVLHAPWRPVEDALKDGTAHLFHGVHEDPPKGGWQGVQAGDDWFAILVWDIWRPAGGWVFSKDGDRAWSEPDAVQFLEVPLRSQPPGPDDITYDAAAAFARLSVETQRAIGAAGLGFGASIDRIVPYLDFCASDRHLEVAADECERRLRALAEEALGTKLSNLAAPDLNGMGIRQCVICGCTDECACDGGCSWVGPTTCSACVEAGRLPAEQVRE